MGETTEIFNRKVRHWKTTILGAGVLVCGVAAIIWPAHALVISQISSFLTGSAFLAAADAKPK